MGDTGVDLSPASLDALAETRRRSDMRLLMGLTALTIFAAWLFG
jgi:ubiquinone biosynthesis protein